MPYRLRRSEMDVALECGEIDARAVFAETLITRNAECIQKKLVDLHAIVEVPKRNKPTAFTRLSELETFITSDKEHKLVTMYRTFSLGGDSPYIFPPGTRKSAGVNSSRGDEDDPQFHREFKKFSGFEASPIMLEEMEKAIRELPRDKIKRRSNCSKSLPAPTRCRRADVATKHNESGFTQRRGHGGEISR
jgi:hypothetical protein